MEEKKNKPKNHPKKGDVILVEPIKSKQKIEEIRALLKGQKSGRDLALLELGVSSSLRAGDFLNFRISDVRELVRSGSFQLREQKTGKVRRVGINNKAMTAIEIYLTERLSRGAEDEDFFFSGQRNPGKQPMTTSWLTRLLKKWASSVGISGNFGSHSLRKTGAYHRHQGGCSLASLCVWLGHSGERMTARYIGIDLNEIEKLNNFEI
ncbi:tyrosine-type recombinase/integrase [Desulfobotulus sp. H1]|uniref:Tyrosine-type recombinase/integrase n=1 Tax=Desulfobotulus pelophilus TaxID=2823377 RepID=A0ABT3N5K3_9BACT|nr:tyrosine-type recombinase/integrase [Desulfobotulus pelophilus]MCW7752729.1 tyrosine-type recombinase/integrase [Desulfobotulus pelophilus]